MCCVCLHTCVPGVPKESFTWITQMCLSSGEKQEQREAIFSHGPMTYLLEDLVKMPEEGPRKTLDAIYREMEAENKRQERDSDRS